MENIFEELGIPKKYLKKTAKDDRFIALVHKAWLKSLVKYLKLSDFIEKSRLEVWPTAEDELNLSWMKIYISIFKKKDCKVIPLPRIRASSKDEHQLLFTQLLEYISQTNYKNLWKEAYKKCCASEFNKATQVNLLDYNNVLKETITRIYGCPIINTYDSELSVNNSKTFDVNLNILPGICAVETLNAIFLLHSPYFEHNLNDCVTFSPAILDKCYTKPLFIVYQLINILKSVHDRSLTLGDISLSDIYMTEDLWIKVFPQINSNIYVQEISQLESKNIIPQDCRKAGHTFCGNQTCEFCGLRTYDRVQVTNENLEKLCQLWIDGQISNFTYISTLNRLSGRKQGDPNCHYVFPWVTDFASRCGKNWRDLKKSKYRLNKGDRQLDLTYDNSQSQTPHHVSDVLSPITYYVYMARKTPKSVLCKNVRTIWVPAEYPSTIQRMQEWTPDECIPEFYTDPSVFRSIHDDLDDLEVPVWSSGPEDFIEKHREALESPQVSEKLHYWIDLTFGYKLTGNAAIKAKNVCLNLVDEHENLIKSGLVQLFFHPHPPKAANLLFLAKYPPKVFVTKPVKQRARERSHSSVTSQEVNRSDEDEQIADDFAANCSPSSLGVSKKLSRSRSSLHEDQTSKMSRSPSNQRSTSLGPKNATFTSHVVPKSKINQLSVPSATLSTGIIYLPKEYKPEQSLDTFEKKYAFISKTFHVEQGKNYPDGSADELVVKDSDDCIVQNAFTNFIFTENFTEKYKVKPKATKSHTFPLDHRNLILQNSRTQYNQKAENQIICNYANIISARRVRELQILGCLIVEIFMAKQLRAMGANDPKLTFNKRLKACLTVVRSCQSEIPPCISYVVNLLLQSRQTHDLKNFVYPAVTDFGLPPPSAHLLLEPLLHCIIPFSKHFTKLYNLIYTLKDFKNVANELDILYHFDCNGEMCSEYESLEKTKVLFAQNIGECKVKFCAIQLENLFDELNSNTDEEIVNILLPHIKELLEDPPTSVLAAWYLFEPISKVLGPHKSSHHLLDSILRLYENEPNELYLPYNNKIAKLYHHSFLLRLMVRFELKCFLDNFIVPLVEAVGGYKDYEKVDFILHNHSEKVIKRSAHLKTMYSENMEMSASDESSSSEKISAVSSVKDIKPTSDEDVFEFEDDKGNEEQMKSLIEHLELNVSSDLPFNHSTAEEALDATLTENIDQLRSIEELGLHLNEEIIDSQSLIMSPTIPIPSSFHNNLLNISCDVGSKKSESDSFVEKKSMASQDYNVDSSSSSIASNSQKAATNVKKPNTKISEMSADTIVWLSHRLGPVLTAKYLSRNLLKMLTLCYVGKDNLAPIVKQTNEDCGNISIADSYVVGDQNAAKVMECLTGIAALYGEQIIIFQYIPHMSELIFLCKRKLTLNLEGGLISCLALLKHIIPYLSDAMLMDQLQDVILKNVVHPCVRLLGSTKYTFPSGSIARNVLARKYLDSLYVLAIRMGSDMSRKYLAVPALQRFFLIFDKVHGSEDIENANEKNKDLNKPTEESHYVEYCRDGTTTEWAISGTPVQISLKDSEYAESMSPPIPLQVISSLDRGSVINLSLEELRTVFTAELAHTAYLPFLKHLSLSSLEISLKNHYNIHTLCQEYEQEIKITQSNQIPKFRLTDFGKNTTISASGSIGSNIALIGNRIDIQPENISGPNYDLLSLVSNKMENNTRHLRGNWLAYWEHEIGRSEKDTMFNFKQIKLQTFTGHTHSVKCLYVLDNENSFISGSRDKTVKLWSLRSQGDGFHTSNCQWTYSAHKKSILSLTFMESMRLVASCDSVVHIWDPFMGANLANLEAPKNPPVNVVHSMTAPSSLLFTATTDGTVRVIDARILNYIHELKISASPSGLIRCLVIAPSGQWIAAGQSSGNITVLDTRTGLVLSNWRAHESEVLKLVTIDDNTLISSSLDQTISVWNVSDGKFKFYLRGATEPVHCLNVYNNELISGTTANRIGVHTAIDVEASFSSTKLRSDTFKGLLTSMALLPLNRLLLLGADTGNISLLC